MKKWFLRFFSIGLWSLVILFFIVSLWPYTFIKEDITYEKAVKSISCGGEEHTLTAAEQKLLFDALRDIRFIRIPEFGSYQKTEETIEMEICPEISLYYYKLIITEENAFIYDELKQLREEASPNPIKKNRIPDSYYYPVVLCDDSLAQIREILIK